MIERDYIMALPSFCARGSLARVRGIGKETKPMIRVLAIR